MSDNITNIYCDESCHLLNDHNDIMAFGAIFLKKEDVREISKKIRFIKQAYNCNGELKWIKVSLKNIAFYEEIINLFFKNEHIGFRSLIVNNKSKLDHNQYNHGSHDSFYYKMYYYLIRNIVENHNEHPVNVFIDIKDTKSVWKIHYLKEVLSNKFYDFKHERILKIQQIRSNESEILQLCDFLLGAVSFRNRRIEESCAKIRIVQLIEEKIRIPLFASTPPWETKFNLFHFVPRQGA